jgi:hypothetical protein
MTVSDSPWNAPFMSAATRPAACSRPLVRPSLANRPEASAAVPPRWPQFPPNTLVCLPLLTTEDHGPSSNASSKRLPPWVRLD